MRNLLRLRLVFGACVLAVGLLSLVLLVRCLPAPHRPRLRCAVKSWLRPAAPVVFAQPLSPSDAALADLKRQVLRDYPELADESLPDWQKVCCLRAWAYSHIDVSAPALCLDANKDLKYYTLPAPEVFAQFAADRGGVFCGGTAYALGKLFEAFGYTSYVVNSGDPSVTATHCSTLVEIAHHGRKVVSIQDAYFNVGYVDCQGEPLDYLDMLELLAARRHEEIATTTDGRAAKPEYYLLYPVDRELCSVLWGCWAVDPDGFSLDFLTDGRIRCVGHRRLDRCEALWGPKRAHPFLAREGLPRQVVYLYLYPLTIARSDYVWANNLLEQAKQRAAGD